MVTYVLAAKLGENPVWTEPIEWEVVNEYNGLLDLVSTKALWKDEIKKFKGYGIETSPLFMHLEKYKYKNDKSL